MIFKTANIDGYYKVAMVEVDDGDGNTTEDWWVLPDTQTILLDRSSEKDKAGEPIEDTFEWPSWPKDQAERFLNCAEFQGKNANHMFARKDSMLKKCIKVTYGDGETCSLEDYLKAGRDPMFITDAPEFPQYYKAKEK